MKKGHSVQRRVSAGHAGLRRVGSALTAALLPCRVVDGDRGLERAAHLLREGGGLIALMNHFSFRDAPQALALLCSNRLIREREILAPVALHQYRRYATPVRACASLFAVCLAPVVTPHTEGEQLAAGELRQSLKAYVSQASAVLAGGGIVLLAPQGRRQAHLGAPPGRPVAQLLRRLPAEQRAGVGLTFIGLSIPGEADYTRRNVGALNLGRRYEARIGATVTVREALGEVSELGAEPDLRAVDSWVYERLRRLVPPAYREAEGQQQAMASGI